MKNFKLPLFIVILCSFLSVSAQEVPSINIKKTDGSTISTDSIHNDGKPMIISFWATWCKPCVKELTAIAEVYEEWQEKGIKLVAISIDDQRTFNNVAPFVNGKDWPFEVYCDPNGDFKRALGVNMVPHTFIIDENRKVFWQHTSFAEGGELEMIDIIEEHNKSISE